MVVNKRKVTTLLAISLCQRQKIHFFPVLWSNLGQTIVCVSEKAREIDYMTVFLLVSSHTENVAMVTFTVTFSYSKPLGCVRCMG